jgi:hypothetical protein
MSRDFNAQGLTKREILYARVNEKANVMLKLKMNFDSGAK